MRLIELELACACHILSEVFLKLAEAAAPDDTDLYMELVSSKQRVVVLEGCTFCRSFIYFSQCDRLSYPSLTM